MSGHRPYDVYDDAPSHSSNEDDALGEDDAPYEPPRRAVAVAREEEAENELARLAYARTVQDARADAAVFRPTSARRDPVPVATPTPIPKYVAPAPAPATPPQRGPVVLPQQTRQTSASMPATSPEPRRRTGLACVGRAAVVVCEGLCGVWELVCVAAAALRDVLSIEAQYARREDSPESSAVRGRLLGIVVLQTLLLGVQLGLLGAVGMTGPLAEVVHMPYVTAQTAAVASVLLGTYVYVFGAVDPSQRSGDRVYSLYLVVELAAACGGGVNVVRWVTAYDERAHVAAAISPGAVEDETWDHGVCGQPHFIEGFMLAAAAAWVVLSGLNAVALMGRNRPKLKAAESPPPSPQKDASAVHVDMPPREEADDDAEEEEERPRYKRPPRRRNAQQMHPVSSAPPRTATSMTVQRVQPPPGVGIDHEAMLHSVLEEDDY